MPAQRFPGFLRSLSWPIGSGYSIATGVSVFFLPSISRVLLLAVMRADDRGVVGLQLDADEPPKEARSRCLAASMMVPVSENGASTRSASVEILRASYSYSYPSRCGSTIYAVKLVFTHHAFFVPMAWSLRNPIVIAPSFENGIADLWEYGATLLTQCFRQFGVRDLLPRYLVNNRYDCMHGPNEAPRTRNPPGCWPLCREISVFGQERCMAHCDVCGNDYDKSFRITQGDRTMTFDSFECAIHAMAPAALTANAG